MATPSLCSRVIESQGQNTDIVSIRDRVQSGISDEGWTVHAVTQIVVFGMQDG